MTIFKKILKIIGIVFASIIVILVAYSGIIVIKARIDTPKIIAEQMKTIGSGMTLDELSKNQIFELLKIEDPNFYTHKGIDFTTPGAGITTISQGLVKLLYFEKFSPGFAKLKQSLIARFAFDPLVSKDDQLTLFINMVYLGNKDGKSIYGFENAAEAYFHTGFTKLTNDEYLSLIAMVIAPNTFSIATNPKANQERVERMKHVIAGTYIPKGLMDIYYGILDTGLQSNLPTASYYPELYK